MKLYNLFEEVILEGLITESVSTQQVVDTIDGEYANNGKKFVRRIRIHYDGDDVKDKFGNVTREGKGWRNIVIHAYGNHKQSNREVVRAYQVYGDSLRTPNKEQGWKLFRLDRITHWEPTNLKYWEPIQVAGQETNMTGDDSMVGEVKVVNFEPKDGSDVNSVSNDNNVYNYDNADTGVDNSTPTIDKTSNQDNGYEEEEVETDNVYNYDNAKDTEPKHNAGAGFDSDDMKQNKDVDYEEEDVEDEDDEIKDY